MCLRPGHMFKLILELSLDVLFCIHVQGPNAHVRFFLLGNQMKPEQQSVVIERRAIPVNCTCRGYKERNLCKHSIAVAAVNNMLSKFIEWFMQHKAGPNLDNISLWHISSQKGKKKSDRTRKRKKATDQNLEKTTLTTLT